MSETQNQTPKTQSIHPRVVKGMTVYEKVNTSKKKNPDVTRRKIEAIEEHLSRHPTDMISRNHVDKLMKAL